ncbi:MAG: HlyD family secretion protein [Bacteroidia bacterium]|jgi:HlyD family secretion protein
MKRTLKFMGVIVFVALFVYTMYYLYQKSIEKPIRYSTETAFTTNIIKKTVATGSVVPKNEIEIKPQLSGIIEQLFVEPGQQVIKGDLIAKIRVIPNMTSLNNAESRVNRARIELSRAKNDYNRNKPLFDQGVVSPQEMQSYTISLENAQEEYSSANDNLKITRDGVSSRTGSTSNLIKSTVSGTVLDVPVEVGNSVIEANNFNAGTTIAFVADMKEMIFEGRVDESEVGKLKPGMELILTLGALENEQIKAILSYISPKGVEDQGAIQFEIKAVIKNETKAYIRANYSANADVVLQRKDNVLAISEGLLIFEGKETFVEVEISEQAFERRSVKLGLSDGINVEVLSGVSKEDRIKSKEIIETKPDNSKEKGRQRN